MTAERRLTIASAVGARLVLALTTGVLAATAQAQQGMDHSAHGTPAGAPQHSPMQHDGMDHGAMTHPPVTAPSPAASVPPLSDADRAAAFPDLPPHAMHQGGSNFLFLADQLEWQDADEGSALAWDISGWYGGDIDRLAFRSEGERTNGHTEEAELQLLWSHAIGPWWETVAGVRQDFKPGSPQTWAAFGVQGMPLFGLETEATAFLGEGGQSALRLEAEYPWAIPPSKREEWRRELRTLVDYQYQTYGPREPLEPERPRYYPNMDVHHLLIMEWAHRLFGDDRYAADRDTMLQWLDDALYPDGGWTYHWPQNECYVYHQLNVTFIARYLEATGDQRARAILRKSAGYYPLVHDGEGMTESWSDCSWKHYWTAAAPAGADVIAGMFDDPANKRAALDAGQDAYDGGQSAVYTGPWWKDLKPADRPDKVLVYDRSVEGPRGQYGVFSFGGTGRVTAVGEIGKDTFVGCLIADRREKPLPLDAALQVATVEARLKPDGGHWQNARYCSGRERFSQIVTPEFATLCVRYRITRPAWGHGSTDEPFEGIQQWLLCQDRLIGRLTIRALEDTQCAGLWGRLRFGMRKEIEVGENGWYKYGGLLAKVHAHDFARVETAPSETFFLDKPEGYRSREILLKDDQATSGKTPPYPYRAGHERYFLGEVLPYWSEPATEVSQVHDGAVLGFSFRAGGKRYTVLHNVGETAVKQAVKPAGAKGVVWSPGGPQGEMVKWSGGEVAIPAGEQVVVVSP